LRTEQSLQNSRNHTIAVYKSQHEKGILNPDSEFETPAARVRVAQQGSLGKINNKRNSEPGRAVLARKPGTVRNSYAMRPFAVERFSRLRRTVMFLFSSPVKPQSPI
jgi:hypothetical protein